LTDLAPDDTAPLVDLSGMTLERIARLCGPSASGLDANDVADRPVLRQALLRVQREGARASDLLAGFSSHLL
jgi:hypothetical protein